eukprot:1243620-Alexandrium_andersonii.AAC.1
MGSLARWVGSIRSPAVAVAAYPDVHMYPGRLKICSTCAPPASLALFQDGWVLSCVGASDRSLHQ